jgi:DNA repair protein RadC
MDEPAAQAKPSRNLHFRQIVDKSRFAIGRGSLQASQLMEGLRILSPADAFTLFDGLAEQDREHLWSACIDRDGTVLAMRRDGPGEAFSTALPVSSLLGEALACRAWGLIVAHNHPDGSANPSAQDIRATRRLAEGAQALGLRLIDHVVVADGAWTSFRLMGLL